MGLRAQSDHEGNGQHSQSAGGVVSRTVADVEFSYNPAGCRGGAGPDTMRTEDKERLCLFNHKQALWSACTDIQ